MKSTLDNVFNFLNLKITDFTEIEKSKLLWLIKLRWSFILIQILILIPYLLINYRIFRIGNYLGICLFLIFFNLISLAILNNVKKEISPHVCFINLIVDLLAVAALISFIQRELYFSIDALIFVHVIIGSIILDKKFSNIFYLVSAVLLYLLNDNNFYFAQENKIKIMIFNQMALFLIWFMIRIATSFINAQREFVQKVKLDFEKHSRLKALGALTAGFSHEFSSPLNTLKLRVNRLARKLDLADEEITESMLAIAECEKIIKQINSSQLDNRDFLYKKIDISNTVESLVGNWKLEFSNVELKLKKYNVNVVKELPYVNFSQCLINLLDNAHQSLNSNQIEVEVIEDDQSVHIKVKDDGEGFNDLILKRFGEPFITTKKTGTGLGLYTTNLFVQSIGGELSIRNREHKGAEVMISIPKD